MADHGGTSERLWTIRAPVLERPPRPPTACHAILTSDPPAGCSGVEVVGLDPRTVPGAEIHPGGTVFTPTLRLTGSYDGGRLVLTEPATLAQDRAYPPPPMRRRTGRVLLWVVAAGPEQTQFLLDRYGPHLVVESWLEPVPPR